MLGWVKKHARKILLAGVALTALYVASPTTRHETRVVQEGDYLSKFAREELVEENRVPSMEEIISRTNQISELNGMGTIEEFPWHPNYECGTEGDPNCIYPGQEIILQEDEECQESLLGLMGISLATLYMVRRRESPKVRRNNSLLYPDLEDLIDEKNLNPYKSYEGEGFSDYFSLKVEAWEKGENVEGMIERYDGRIAPDEMKSETIELYANSEMNLKQVSEYLTEKYGMRISTSTISKHARRELKVENRRQIRNQFN